MSEISKNLPRAMGSLMANLMACLMIMLLNPSVSYAVSCTGVAVWKRGGQSCSSNRQYGGRLYSNSCANGWDGASHNPASNPHGHWTDLGACGSEPVMTTSSASGVTGNTMTLNGVVTSDNGFAITDRGFLYGTVAADVTNATLGSPLSASVVSEGGTAVSSFNAGVSGLCPGVTYYIKSYATNTSGSGYGSNVSRTTSSPGIYNTTQDGAFTSAATWGGCSAPNPAIVGHTINIGHAVSRSGLTVAAGTDVTVNSGGVLTVTGTVSMGYGGSSLTVDVGGELSATNVRYTTNGVITSNGTFNVSNNLTIQSNGTATFNGTTTVGGDAAASGPGDFDVTGGTFTLVGDLDCSADGTFTADGTVLVGGDWSVFGSGSASVGGIIDVAGEFSVKNSGYVVGSGVINWVTKDINPANSGAYVGCVDGSKYDDNSGTPSWDVPPGPPMDLTTCGLGVLPVELLSFLAEKQGEAVAISWTTGSELNLDYFEVLFSYDGVSWESLSLVNGQGDLIYNTNTNTNTNTNSMGVNTSDFLKHYAVYDRIGSDLGAKFYKLKQVDVDGSFVFSETLLVSFEASEGFTHVVMQGAYLTARVYGFAGVMSLEVFDVNGQQAINTSWLLADAPSDQIQIRADNLEPGVYFLRLSTLSSVHFNKFYVK